MYGFLCILMLVAPLPADDKLAPEDETAGQLAKVRRIYVDILTGGDTALQLRDLLMASLQRSKQFIITENEDKADATLKGAGEDEVYTDSFQSSEGINAHTQIGGSESAGTRNYASSSKNHSAGLSIGENSSRHTEERKH